MRGRITSHHNPKIKSLLSLEKPRERKKQCLFIIEGIKEITMARDSGYTIGNIFYNDELVPEATVREMAGTTMQVFPVSQDVFDKIARRETSGGLIAVAEYKTHRLADIKLPDNPFIIVLEAVEKPGNLGAILRTADAAGVDAVIICDSQTDVYNPNVIRSSIGCLFTQQVGIGSSEEAIAFLKHRGVKIFCTSLQAAVPYHTVDYKGPTAVVMGTEATGLSATWTDASTQNVIIPMSGKIDSMNVSTATAVMVFEARRQRGFKTE